MKPTKAPADLEWQTLPTFDDLKEQSKIKVSLLRLKLADVPCWKCEDNSVRYDLEAAELAIAPEPGAAEVDAAGEPTLLGMLQQQLQINAVASKQFAETIKSMGEPLRAGVEMCRTFGKRQEQRLAALEATFDRMLDVLEKGHTAQHERDLETKRQASNIELRKGALATVSKQLPNIVDKWGLTAKAKLAVDLVDSLEPEMVDTLIGMDGILSDEQKSSLQQLRSLSPKPGTGAAAAGSNTTNGAPS